MNRRTRGLLGCRLPGCLAGALLVVLAVAPATAQEWFDNFDEYEPGSTAIGQGDWAGWDLAPVDADIVDDEAFSEPNSLRLRTDTDLVAVYAFVGGLWEIRAQIFVPSDHFGETFFILLNTYAHGAAAMKDWSTQVRFSNGTVSSLGGTGFGGSGSLPWRTDEWVELRIVVDLDQNQQVITYGGELLDVTPWFLSGGPSIGAIDLYSANGSPVYFDDIAFSELDGSRVPRRALCSSAPSEVRIVQGLPSGARPTDPVDVVERVLGDLRAQDVDASDDGIVVDLFPTGTLGGAESTFVTAWLFLGPFQQSGGNNPGLDNLALDYLTDGEFVEDEIEPVEGEAIDTDYELAASTGLAPTVNPEINPTGLPTWYAFLDSNDTVDFNGDEYYGEDIDNVMVYAASYFSLEDDVDALLCVGSDDSIEVKIDGVTVHANSIPRGYGGAQECQDLVPIGVLEEGEHLLLVKIFEGGGGHGFRLGFQDLAGGPLEGLSVCLTPDVADCSFDPIGIEISWGVTRADLDDGLRYSIDTEETGLEFQGFVGEEFIWSADAELTEALCSETPPEPTFVRGDADSSGGILLTDGVVILTYLFQPDGVPPRCFDSADSDDNGRLDLTDAVRIFGWLFQGGATPAPPTPSAATYTQGDCGVDTTLDELDCATPAATCS